MPTVESVKKDGAESALFGQVSSSLWEARRALEHAGEHSGRSFTRFLKEVKLAREKLDEAEEFYDALMRMKK